MDGQFFKDHLVLSEGACLVAHDVVNPTKFLGDLTVSGDGALNLFIFVDAMRKDSLRDVQVDP